jgi:Cu(I)/Ag(I) efflux system membrane fusion protein
MTRSAKVRVELPNPIVEEDGRKHRLLLHRLYADGVVKLEIPAALAVPRTAILAASEPLVYVEVGNGAYEQRKVKLGRHGDDFVEVLDGVRAGERVVTTGNLLIDAQAQLNVTGRSMSGAATSNSPATSGQTTATSLKVLSSTQQQVTREFLQLTSDLGASLAADDLKKFNDIAPRVHATIPKLIDSLGDATPLRPALQKLEESGHLETAKDLAAARKEFLGFSIAAVELAKPLRSTEPFKTIKIFNCPMVDRAVRGAGKNGPWIQIEGPLRNPFFGAEMIDCGSEVKP